MCELWDDAKSILKNQMSRSQFVGLFEQTTSELDIEVDILTVFTNSSFDVDWLENRLRPLIERAVSVAAKREMTIVFRVKGQGMTESSKPRKEPEKDSEGKENEDGAIEIYGYTPIFDVVATRLGTMTALVFGVVWRHCQMKLKVCTASVARLADLTGIAEKTIRRHLAVLVEAGYLEDTTPGIRNKAHIYRDTGKIRFRVSVEAIVDD